MSVSLSLYSFKYETIKDLALAYFHAELLPAVCLDVLVNHVDFVFGQRAIHRSVDDAIGLRGALLLLVVELVDEQHLLDEVTADRSHEIAQVQRVDLLLAQPHGQVVDALRIDADGFVANGARGIVEGELPEKAGVVRPEQANVRDAVHDHGDAFETETERPADVVSVQSAVLENAVFHEAAAEQFVPFAVDFDFVLPRWMREGKGGVDPT